MRKFFVVTLFGVIGFGGLFLLAGRNLSEFAGYFQASAGTAVEGVVESLPREVHDRKLKHDIRRARQEVIDRQVQLNLSRGQLEQLRSDVEKLSASIGRREQLLAEAYPALKTAAQDGTLTIRFASTDYALPDFQRHLDDLLLMQEREERQLGIKREALKRLEKNAREAERALADMRQALETAEQEIALLHSRRDQAEFEASALNMVAAAGASADDAAAPVAARMEQLRTEVERLEARNQARRDLAPVAERAESNPLGQSWSRLESLKAIHEKAQASETAGDADDPRPADEVARMSDNDAETITARKVRIEVERETNSDR